jgi:hypothetical protein
MRSLSFRHVFAAVMALLALISLFPSMIGVEKIEVLTIGLVILVFLPWLSSFFTEFSAGGITVKLREMEKKIETVAEQQVQTDDQLLRSTTNDNESARKSPTAEASSERIEELVKQYNDVRSALKPGSARTNKMKEIFLEMRAVTSAARRPWSTGEEWLNDADAGRNLAAISYYNVYLDEVKPGQLIDLVERSSQPFIQYWALRTINSYVQEFGARAFSLADFGRLQAFEKILGPSIDRGILVRNINRALATNVNR